jgi:hypothetical protein
MPLLLHAKAAAAMLRDEVLGSAVDFHRQQYKHTFFTAAAAVTAALAVFKLPVE